MDFEPEKSSTAHKPPSLIMNAIIGLDLTDDDEEDEGEDEDGEGGCD